MFKKLVLIACILNLSFSSVFSQKVGLVLSGGGAKGAVHIGVIKALEDNEIPIDYIGGTSAGAIVGSLYAIGYSPKEILDLFMSEDFRYWQSGKVDENYSYYFRKPESTPAFMDFAVSMKDSTGLKAELPTNFINPIQINQAFMGLYSQATASSKGDFNNLFVPFLCVASDVYNKKPIIFRNGDLGLAVRASMTFPFFFKPIICDSIPLFDGGIYDNFPIKPVEDAFSPDFLIGSAVAGSKSKTIDKSLYGQIENMVMQKTDYSVDSEKGILLQFKLEDISLLEFQKSRELYYIGYQKGEKMADSIKARIQRKITLEELTQKRNDFKKALPPLVFKNIIINGANDSQKIFIESQIERSKGGSFDMEDFKKAYFRLLVDSKIKEIIPRAIYNEQENCFDLHLDVTINDELTVAFGGNVSSSNANQLYLGLGYQSLTEYSLNLNLDLQVGNTYNGAVLHGRIEFPWELPVYMTGMAVYNYRKFYEGEKLFLDTELSTFIHQSESYGKIGLGLPFRNKARSEVNFAYGRLKDKYYQNNLHSYFNTDFDRSTYDYFKFSASFKKNTLDTKQYAIVGQEHSIIAQYISGDQKFIPADNKVKRNESHQSWLQISGKVNNYHAINSKFNLGYLLETTISSKNLLNNYTASILQAPAFTPTPHSKLVFNESFRANQFFAGGITPILKLNETIHLRGDFNVFLPIYKIQRGFDNMPYYGAIFRNPSFLSEVSFVIRFPFMSISLYTNHYNTPKNDWNFGLNIGYLIFGPKFIQ